MFLRVLYAQNMFWINNCGLFPLLMSYIGTILYINRFGYDFGNNYDDFLTCRDCLLNYAYILGLG